MEKKILTISSPFCDCYSKLGALSSILANSKLSYDWFLINYMQLLFTGIDEDGWVWLELCGDFFPNTGYEWEYCPYINSVGIENQEISNGNIREFLISNLCDNKYIYCNIDRFYIKEYRYSQEHLLHDLLILGFDYQKKSYLCADYFDVKYEIKGIPFEEIENAFRGKFCFKENDRIPQTFLWEYVCEKHGDEEKHTDHLKKSLITLRESKEFVFGDKANIERSFKGFGHYAYDLIIEKILSDIFPSWDVRPFYAIRDHLKIMIELAARYDIHYDVSELVRFSNLICVLGLKRVKTKKVENRLCSLINDIKEEECRYIDHLLHELK